MALSKIESDSIASTIDLSGISLTLPDGSVTSSKLDTNIAITGNLTVDTNTLYVDSTNNNVGIRTTSPLEILHIKTASSGVTTAIGGVDGAIIESGAGRTGGLLFFTPNDRSGQILWSDPDAHAKGALAYDHFDNHMRFITDGLERMRIDSSGVVGIGATSPSAYANQQLVVYGQGVASACGAPTTTARFEVFSNGQTNNQVTLSQGFGGLDNIGYLYNRANADFVFGTNNTERMRIDSSGNVGIGTTSPATKLVVIGNTSFGSNWEDNTATSLDTYQFGDYAQSITAIQLKSSSTGTGSITFSGDNNSRYGLIQYDHTNDYLRIYTNNTERMRITSAGNVGIGTSSPTQKLDIRGVTDSEASIRLFSFSSVSGTYQNARLQFEIAASATSTRDMDFVAKQEASGTGGAMCYEYEGTERMRIDSSGKVFVGTTAEISGGGTGDWGVNLIRNNDAGYIKTKNKVTGAVYAALFYNANGPVGGITTNGLTTSYATSSDYRLKENVTPMSGSIDRLKQLKPSTWSWVAGGNGEGFIAHEAQEVVPEAISGTKDAVDDEGNPVYQGIDQAKLVPLLTAALQEAITKIEGLETRIQTLENK